MQRQVSLQPAFILHTKSYLNSSLIVTVFTKDHGLVRLIAKGARRIKSKLRSELQQFIPVNIGYLNKTNIGILTEIEQRVMVNILPNNKLAFGLYVNELMVKLLHEHDPHPKLFAHYTKALISLRKTLNVEKTLREFEMLMLNEIGYGIDFFHDAASNAKVELEGRYRLNQDFSFERIIHDTKHTRSFSGKNILSIGSLDFNEQSVLMDAKYILRVVIANKLGAKQIISRKLIIMHDHKCA